MNPLKIRRFTYADLDQITKIETVSFDKDAFSKETFVMWFRRCPNLFIVAEMSIVVGYMISCGPHDIGHVVSIAVDPAYRKKGIGTALVHSTFNCLSACGIRTVELEVRVSNREGISFWKRLGFLPLEIASRFYPDGEDALRMRRTLA